MYIALDDKLLNCPYCNNIAVVWKGTLEPLEYYVQCETTSKHLKLGPFTKLDIIARNWNHIVDRIKELKQRIPSREITELLYYLNNI